MPAGNITVANGEASIETEVGAIPYSEALYACRQAVSERAAVESLQLLVGREWFVCPCGAGRLPPGGELLAARGCSAGLEWLGAALPCLWCVAAGTLCLFRGAASKHRLTTISLCPRLSGC